MSRSAIALLALGCVLAGGCPDADAKSSSHKTAHDAGGGDDGGMANDGTGGSEATRRKRNVIEASNGQQNSAALEDAGKTDAGVAHANDGGFAAGGRDTGTPPGDLSKGDAGSDSGSSHVSDPWTPSVPEDPGARGPWPVGARTLSLDLGTGQHVPVEVWYPARVGSDAGQPKYFYDLIRWLPPEAQTALPAGEHPVNVDCNCYRDLPLDADHGPYPVAIAVHHTGAFRAASVSLMSHWASRGFVVVAADHPKLTLADVLADNSGGVCSGSGISIDGDHKRDLPALLHALRQPAGDFGFLAERLDTTKMAIAGNDDGSAYSAAASGEAGVRLIMQWESATPVQKRGDLQAVVFVTGIHESLPQSYGSIQNAYTTTAARIKPTLLVGVSNAGPLSITEICNARSPLGRNGIELAQKYQLCAINFDLISAIFPCSSSFLPQADANLIFSYATTAALEEFVLGKDERAAWDAWKSSWGEVRESR